MRSRTIKLTSFIALLALFAVAAGYRQGRNPVPSTDRGGAFTIQAKQTTYNEDGTVFSVGDATRYNSSNGSYRHVTINGDVTSVYSHQAGRGFFIVDQKRQLLLKNPIASLHRDTLKGASPEELSSSPKFVRTESLLGYTAYVYQAKDPDTGIVFHEGWEIPELGHTDVKFIDHDRLTGKLVETYEPISIVLGEPDAANLRLPNYPEKIMPPPSLPRVPGN